MKLAELVEASAAWPFDKLRELKCRLRELKRRPRELRAEPASMDAVFGARDPASKNGVRLTPGRRPMRRVTDWLAQFSVLEIAAEGYSAGGARKVTMRRISGWMRFGFGLVAVPFAAYAVWAVFTDATFLPVFLWPVFAVLVVSRTVARKVYLTDEVLALGAAWVATKRGHQFKPGRWRVKGAEADAIGAELARLHTRITITGVPEGAERLRIRERILLANAEGPLREYLQPVLTATSRDPEPLQVESASHTPGEPWPVLARPEPEWPMLPMPEGRRN